MEETKERLFWPDFIRAIACICVALCHFNAAVSNNFTMSQGIGTNFPLDIYIGTIGVNLFFMISGAMLMYVRMKKGKEPLFKFYKKRFQTLYPMYWIAYFIAISISFFIWRGLPSDSWIWILNAISGFNGYLSMLGITPFAFYQIGEWFLGCIICLYIFAPLLLYLMDKFPKSTTVFSLIAYVVLLQLGVHFQLFFMYIPHFVVGILFIKYLQHSSPKLCACAVFLMIILYFFPYRRRDGVIYGFLMCTCLFLILKEIGSRLKCIFIRDLCKWIAKYSYAVFLVHHRLIEILVLRFDLNYLGKRGVILLFLIYCVLTVILSILVYWLNDKILSKISYYIEKSRCKIGQ